MDALAVVDLAPVVYSAGKVFDGLSISRLGTENFLRSGGLEGVASRADLALLEDLRDLAQFVVDHAGGTIDSAFVRAANATITRSGALHPGQLRTQAQAIGVTTPYGHHTPDALTEDGLEALLDAAVRSGDVRENALDLFVNLAKAQPFEDGNKRTAVFVANSLLIGLDAGLVLTIPVDDSDPGLAATFNDRLARAYVYGEHDGVKMMLRDRGLTRFGSQTGGSVPRRKSVDILLSVPEELKERMVNTITWTQPYTGISQQQKFIRKAVTDLCERLEHEHNAGKPFEPGVIRD